jgi:hypothetical protein
MTGSRLMHWILCCLVAAASVAGCTGDTTSSEEGGSLNLNLELAPGIVINEVDWVLSGNGMDPMDGTIDTSAPGATASVEVFGLAPGEDYLVELSATSEDGQVTCGGSANFDVSVGVSTDVMVMLNCKRPARYGGVRVNGKFNICAELAKVVVSPLQTSVGNQIDLTAAGTDVEGDAITYVWTGTGGIIADPNATSTTYTCGEVGDQIITISVSDDSFEFCMAEWSVPVTCVEGPNLCEDVVCEDDGNECTDAACNPANGACETSDVEDGTECEGGTCSGGECVAVDPCADVDCNDNNECTEDACDPADGSCSNTAVADGADCGDGGMCVEGDCVETDLCEGVVCEPTGNECTVAMCNMQTGECDTMNAPDGTACNGTAGACSNGACVDNNLCDGVDCTSDNQCVGDGTCDPADGSCIAGNNEPADTVCNQDGGAVCNGSGACVECNGAGQCPSDANECTAASCAGGQCGQANVADGTPCNDNTGACSAGVCMSNDLCIGVDCTSSNQCVDDGTCNPATGTCTAGANKATDTPCTEGGGSVCDGAGSCVECNNDEQCSGSDVCTDNACVAGGVDPDAQSKVITVGCKNNVTADISILPYALTVDPGVIVSSAAVSVTYDGVAEFAEAFLDAAQGAVPGGVTKANLVNILATTQVRSGGTFPNVGLVNEPIPYECALSDTGPGAQVACNPANDLASVPGSRGNTGCTPTGTFNPCGRFVYVPTSNVEATCDALGAAKAAQFDTNGFCVTGGLPLPLQAQASAGTAGASGPILFGWFDNPSVCPFPAGSLCTLPAAVFTAAIGPIGLKVNASGLSVALECNQASDQDPNAIKSPDSDLIPFPI